MTVRAAEARRLAGARFLRTFHGTEPTPGILRAIREGRAAGVSIFRYLNVEAPGQVRALVAALQAARPVGSPPLLVGIDQEGGQLQAVGDGATAWPGNLAIGATGSGDLARRAGVAIATEVAAMGCNVLFAPVCDVIAGGSSAAMGTRPFGSDPALVARLAAAMATGIESTGVAATLKHFPGHGAASGDSHVGLPLIDADRVTLDGRELVPFRAGIAAGARMVMAGHLAVPALTGTDAIPATLARSVLRGVLRDELGFGGVTCTDAMNMRGIGEPERIDEVVVGAASAGDDLLLMLHDEAVEDGAAEALERAIADGRLDGAEAARSAARVDALRRSLAGLPVPSLDVVGCAEHADLAAEIARRAVTLVRDRDGVLPLGRAGRTRVRLIAPAPADLTPAETSSQVRLGLGDALRVRGLSVDERPMPLDPAPADVAELTRAGIGGVDAVVVGTIDAVDHPGQAAVVTRLVESGVPVVAVALRGATDLEAYPSAGTYACAYGVQPPNVEALADALTGRAAFEGTLPVRLALRESVRR